MQCHEPSATEPICAACRQQYFIRAQARCYQCALPLEKLDDQSHCGECLSTVPHFDRSISACSYAPPLDQLVLGLKFMQSLAYANLMATQIAEQMRALHAISPDLLCAVPLGPQRLIERGFNQALEIAKPLAKKLSLPLQPQLLIRLRDTLPQGHLSGKERKQNLSKAFILNPEFLGQIEGKHIGVVDDVITTGTSLNEIAKLLKRFGASQVTNLVFARTSPHSF
ncbi:MAG: ComF family protein [Undibacterium sp.]|nr:ComF family protein [Undibacterium sp.]